MSKVLHKDGTVIFSVDSGDKLAVYSQKAVKVYYRTAEAHRIGPWGLLATTTPGTEYLSAAMTEDKDFKFESSSAITYYSTGTDPFIAERRAGLRGQGTPGVLDATGALTAAMMGTGLVTSAAAAVTATVPTGTVMDAAVSMEIGDAFDWAVIKVGANSFTVTAATGHTLVGSGVVATATSVIFRTRKTAANTFVTYRVAG